MICRDREVLQRIIRAAIDETYQECVKEEGFESEGSCYWSVDRNAIEHRAMEKLTSW